MECLLPYLCMVTAPHIMVGLEKMLDYRGVELARFHCKYFCTPQTETQRKEWLLITQAISSI